MRFTIKALLLFLFQIFLLVFCLLSPTGTEQLIIFHLYLITLMFCLYTNVDPIDFSCFGRLLFYISGFVSLVVVYQATNGFSELKFYFQETGKLWLQEGGDPITMPRALEINIITVLFYPKKNIIDKILAIVFVLSDVIGLLSFNNRSTIICSLFIVLIWLFFYYFENANAQKILLGIVVCAIVAFIFNNVPYFYEKIQSLYVASMNGLGTLFGWNVEEIDPSAQTRNEILKQVARVFFASNKTKNILFGLGYNYIYVDRPVLQVLFDLGTIPFLLYIFYLLYIPIKVIVREVRLRLEYNNAWVYIAFISIQFVADQFVTGLPYYYFLWTPTIFFLFSKQNANNREIIYKRLLR